MEIRLDPEMHVQIEQWAAEIGQSAPAWCQNAIARAYIRWRSPKAMRKAKTGEDVDAVGMWCDRCAAPAESCTHPELHQQWDEWRVDEE